MSESLTIENKGKKEAKEAELLSPLELAQKKQEMFEIVKTLLPENDSDLDHALIAVAEHSIDDAIELCKDIGILDIAVEYIFKSPNVARKHPTLFSNLSLKMVSLGTGFPNKSTSTKLYNLSDTINGAGSITEKQLKFPIEVKQKIDSYYSELLRFRKVKEISKDSPRAEERTKAQKKGMELLRQQYEMLVPHVWGTKLREIIKDKTGKDIYYDKKTKDINTWADHISFDDAKEIAKKFGVELKDEELEKHRYRPLDVTYNMKVAVVESDLKREICENLEKEGYKEPEVFFDSQDKEYKVRVKVPREGKNEAPKEKSEEKVESEKKIDFEKSPKREEWNMLNGHKGIKVDYIYVESGLKNITGVEKTGRKFYIYEGGPFNGMDDREQIVDYKTGKIYSINSNGFLIVHDTQSTSREAVYEAQSGEKISYLTLVGGKPAYVVENTQDGKWKLMLGQEEVTDSSIYNSSQKIKKIFDVNGKCVVYFHNSFNDPFRRSSFLQIFPGEKSATISKDFDGDSDVDIQSYGTDDFVAVGYLDGKPVAYTKDRKINLEHGLGNVKKFIVSNDRICVVRDKGVTYVSLIHATSSNSILNSVDVFRLNNKEVTVHENDNYYQIYNHENARLCNIPKSDYEYHSIKIINDVPFVILKCIGATDRGKNEYFLTKLYTKGDIKGAFAENPNFHFTGLPQIIEQNDRVVFAGMQNGKFVTYEWMKNLARQDLAEVPEEEVEEKVLSVKDLKGEDGWDTFFNQSMNDVISSLNMLGLIKNANTENIEELKQYLQIDFKNDGWKEKLEKALSRSPKVASVFNKILRNNPEVLVDDMCAVPDKTDRVYIDYLIGLMVPELKVVMRGCRMASNLSKGLGFYDASPRDYFRDIGSMNLFGGDPTRGFDKELFRTSDESGEMYVTGMYFEYDNGKWTKKEIEINESIMGGSSEVTAEIKLGSSMSGKMVLPKRIGGKIIEERVKIVYEDGREEKVKVEKNKFNESFVNIEFVSGMKSLVWSQEVPDVPYIPADISLRDGFSYAGNILKLPPEEEYFIKSLEGKKPKDKLYAIEKYVKHNSYYDFKNGEVMQYKDGLSPDELLSFMQIRAKELGVGKRFAGVCADFALLTTAILRKAGINAGIASGAVPVDGVATVGSAHALSVVLWPDPMGNRVVAIDGTPNEGVTDEETKMLGAIAMKSLSDREKEAEKIERKSAGEIMRTLDEIEKRLGSGEKDVIKNIQNGELEKMLNTVLKYEVKPEHTAVIKRLFEASRFAGLPVFSEKLEDKLYVKKFIENESKSEREKIHNDNANSGTELFEIFREYLTKNNGDIDKVEKIVDLFEGGLGKVERRVLLLLVQYLKAEKMKR